MANKKLISVWDGKKIIPNNILFLKEKAKEVLIPISDTTHKIMKDLLDTYKVMPCAGIAANQIGYDKRIFIGLKYDDYDDGKNKEDKLKKTIIGNPNAENYEFYINPQIDYFSNKSIQEGEEGCLSIPDIRLITERYDKIKVRYFNDEGKKIKKPLSGFISRLFQHELDHLDGILMVESNKIKSVYKIVENPNLDSLYFDLVKQISEVQ